LQAEARAEAGRRVVTHRVCDACIEEAAREIGGALPEVLESLRLPALAVDADSLVAAANATALAALGIDRSRAMGRPLCEVLGCVEGRCRIERRCEGCTIRRAIQHTRARRLPLEHVVAHQALLLPEGERRMRIMFSTEAVGRCALVRIEEMSPDRRRLAPEREPVVTARSPFASLGIEILARIGSD
jgi:PAS domain-containing protein